MIIPSFPFLCNCYYHMQYIISSNFDNMSDKDLLQATLPHNPLKDCQNMVGISTNSECAAFLVLENSLSFFRRPLLLFILFIYIFFILIISCVSKTHWLKICISAMSRGYYLNKYQICAFAGLWKHRRYNECKIQENYSTKRNSEVLQKIPRELMVKRLKNSKPMQAFRRYF